MALTTLSFVKQALNIPLSTTTNDTWLSALKDSAEAVIKKYCDRNFEVATYTEYTQGDGQKYLVLKQRPVTSITSLYLDWNGNYGTTSGAFASETLLTSGTDYALVYDSTYNGSAVSEAGLVLRIKTVWAEAPRLWVPYKITMESLPAPGSIKVVYTAGYNPIPQDIQYAVAFMVSAMRRDIPVGGSLESEKIGDYSYRLHFPMFPNEPPELGHTRQLLSRYREGSF